MRGKREVVHLLDLVLQVQEDAEEQGLSEIAGVAAVQADTLEYILGVEGTDAENFVREVDSNEDDDDDFVAEDIEDVIASFLNGSIERAYRGQ